MMAPILDERIVPLARRDTRESSKSPEAHSLRKEAIIKKWQRLIRKVIKLNHLNYAIKTMNEYEDKINKQTRMLHKLKHNAERQVKHLCLPSQKMQQKELVESYVEYNMVEKPKR